MPILDPAISRRSFFRFAAGASALATLPFVTEAHLALAQRGRRIGDPNSGVHIDSNENPLGPCDARPRSRPQKSRERRPLLL